VAAPHLFFKSKPLNPERNSGGGIAQTLVLRECAPVRCDAHAERGNPKSNPYPKTKEVNMGNSQITDAVAAMLQASFEYQPIDGDTQEHANACLPGAVQSSTSSSNSNLRKPPPCPPLGEMAKMSKDVREIEDPTQRKRRTRNGTVMETAAETAMRFHL
jgi:hypothetical protein